MIKKFAVVAGLLALSGAAGAQVYVGGAFGPSNLSVDCASSLLSALSAESTPTAVKPGSCREDDSGYKLYGGLALAPDVAAEIGYINFGRGSVDFYFLGVPLHIDDKADAVTMAAAFRHVFTPKLTGVLRLGLANASVKLTTSEGSIGSGTQAKFYGGLALEYQVAPKINLTASYDATKSEIKHDEITTKASLQLYSVGVSVGF